MAKKATSSRLSDRALSIVKRLAEKHGISEASVVEMALRRMERTDLSEGGWPAMAIMDLAVAILEGKASQKGR